MKRPIPSFTVEVRRRPGRAAHPATGLSAFETKPVRTEWDRDTDRAIAEIFGAKSESSGPKSESVAPVAAPQPEPTGRVLDSLIVEPPLHASFERELPPSVDLAPERDAEPRLRGRRSEAPGAKARRGSQPGGASEVHSPRPQAAAGGQGEGDLSDEGFVLVKTKTPTRRGSKPQAAPAPEVRIPRALAPAPSSLDNADEAAPRKRKIMGRYVYGDVPKPGERWKQKLRRKW